VPDALRDVNDRVRTPLLQLITQQSLDEDYQHVASRGPRTTQPKRSLRLTGVAVVAFGVLVAVAAVQTSRTAPVREASKEELITRVSDQRDQLAALQKQIADLRAGNGQLETTLGNLGGALAATSRQAQTLGTRTGFVADTGEGVVVTVDDGPSGTQESEVHDSDLAALINGLWEAGATAISVNGQRITPLSAPRNSGTVIRLNGVSLSSPYTVVALGDTRTLSANFEKTSSGARFGDVTRTFGMPTTMHNGSDLGVPAAPPAMLSLKYATRLHDVKEDM
jgi:uncharacterized protein YlxW (UPF0749 family)